MSRILLHFLTRLCLPAFLLAGCTRPSVSFQIADVSSAFARDSSSASFYPERQQFWLLLSDTRLPETETMPELVFTDASGAQARIVIRSALTASPQEVLSDYRKAGQAGSLEDWLEKAVSLREIQVISPAGTLPEGRALAAELEAQLADLEGSAALFALSPPFSPY